MTYSIQTQNKINTLASFIEAARIQIREMNLSNTSKNNPEYLKAVEFQTECARKMVKLNKLAK